MKYTKPALTFPDQAELLLKRGLVAPSKQTIASEYGVADRVLDSWQATFNQVRNLCAHHARLWNRAFGVRPLRRRRQTHRPHRHQAEPRGTSRRAGLVCPP